jgi:acetyl esterase/lipase
MLPPPRAIYCRVRDRSAWLALIVVLSVIGTSCAATSRTVSKPWVVERDVEYVKRGDQVLHADVYMPAGAGPFPAVLLVHGGSWQRGDKRRMASIGERLAERGYVGVSIDYRLAPEYRFPAQLYDCQAALRWMRENAERLQLDPQRIAGFGYSAGGHLVGMLATAGDGDGLDENPALPGSSARLQAAVLGGAPIALERLRANFAVERLLGASAAERPDLYTRASPLTFVTPDDPPVFLYHGSADWIVDASQPLLLREALERAGVRSAYYEAPGGHIATFLQDEEPVSRAIDFLDSSL